MNSLIFLPILLAQIGNASPYSLPLNSPTPFVIDTFTDSRTNDLGFWHGPGEDLPVEYSVSPNMGHGRGNSYIRFLPSDPDQNFHTTLSATCFDLEPYRDAGMLLHVEFAGTEKFSISLNQHNAACKAGRMPYPETWDTVEAGRYLAPSARGIADGKPSAEAFQRKHFYAPLSHFDIDQSRVASVSFNGFYTSEPATVYKVEIVDKAPDGFAAPRKLPTGHMVLRCSRPNSFAFGIDDGQPKLAQEVMQILQDEGILVTFFVTGAGLSDPYTNFTEVYREMMQRGHQVALHSFSHPKMEGLGSVEDIDGEFHRSIQTLKEQLGIESRYFRPPFGTVGARTRQRLAGLVENPYIVNWSVDIEDWLWAGTDTPEKQVEAFQRDVRKGGNLVVMHYLSPSTVGYFRELIRFVKSTGVDIMRVDQCVEDPNSPPL